jgi:hypothetical protein
MNKRLLIISTVFFLILSIASHAQSTSGADYFAGKWNVLLKGTPGGDRKIVVVLEKKDTMLSGVVLDTAGNEVSPITKTELRVNELTIYFKGEGYDLNLLMVKKDEDRITGNLLAMFDVEGVRIREKSSKTESNR